jgi:hypothetical protein
MSFAVVTYYSLTPIPPALRTELFLKYESLTSIC